LLATLAIPRCRTASAHQLSNRTYLFEGILLHCDSVGSVQEIRPGAVNWMTAGRGIVHSERTPDDELGKEAILHGMQTWIALPDEYEETEPWFRHHPASELPAWEEAEISSTLIAGEAYGRTSPVQTFSTMIYLDAQLIYGTKFTLQLQRTGCLQRYRGACDRWSAFRTTSVGSYKFRH